jgi:hypothetical protein
MNKKHNTDQAADNIQPETQSPQPEPQPTPTRFQKVWGTLASFVDRRPVRIAVKVTAAAIVLALGVVGYRHYQPSLSENQGV